MGNQVAHSSHAAPPLLVRTVRNTHRLDSGQEYRIGRDDRADIPLIDARVSWEHAVIRAEGPVWVLEDQGSRNGTFLGSERVTRLEITSPYVVHFGHPEDGPVLRFELTAPERPQAPAPDRGFEPQPHGHHVHAGRAARAHVPGADPVQGHEDRPPPGQRHRGRRPRGVQAARGAAAVADRPVPDHRPGQPQRHVRQRHPGQPGRAQRRRHHRDRPRHLPAGRRRADRVPRRRARHVRGARAAGRGARRRQGQGPARRDHVPARRAVHDGGDRPGRRGQVHAAQRADRQAPGHHRQRLLRLP